MPNINTVIQGLQGPSLRAHSNANNRVTGSLVFCESYHQLSEETVSYVLRQTVELRETIRDRHIKRQGFLKRTSERSVQFCSRGSVIGCHL